MSTLYIAAGALFLTTAAATVWLFFKAAHYSKTVLLVITGWAIVQSLLALSGFYQNNTAAPRFPLLIIPAFTFILLLFLTPKGRRFIDALNVRTLTILHIVRIPVEITLYYLYLQKLVPVSMTFEGSNFDILSGISAPVIYLFVFIKGKQHRKMLLAWNIICLLLLINILVIAVLSAQTPFQQMAFEQPNVGVTYFPFVLLPAIIVPLVLLSHLAAIRQLTTVAATRRAMVQL